MSNMHCIKASSGLQIQNREVALREVAMGLVYALNLIEELSGGTSVYNELASCVDEQCPVERGGSGVKSASASRRGYVATVSRDVLIDFLEPIHVALGCLMIENVLSSFEISPEDKAVLRTVFDHKDAALIMATANYETSHAGVHDHTHKPHLSEGGSGEWGFPSKDGCLFNCSKIGEETSHRRGFIAGGYTKRSVVRHSSEENESFEAGGQA